jgi:hypothetical protein
LKKKIKVILNNDIDCFSSHPPSRVAFHPLFLSNMQTSEGDEKTLLEHVGICHEGTEDRVVTDTDMIVILLHNDRMHDLVSRLTSPPMVISPGSEGRTCTNCSNVITESDCVGSGIGYICTFSTWADETLPSPCCHGLEFVTRPVACACKECIQGLLDREMYLITCLQNSCRNYRDNMITHITRLNDNLQNAPDDDGCTVSVSAERKLERAKVLLGIWKNSCEMRMHTFVERALKPAK